MNYNLIAGLLLWISETLGDSPIYQHPVIKIVSHEELQSICLSNCSAAYEYPTVYLSDTLDLTLPVNVGIVLHELTHHYQEVKRRWINTVPCIQTEYREIEAYNLQNIWYDFNGVNKIVRPPMRNCQQSN